MSYAVTYATPDNVTLERDSNGLLRIKDLSVTNAKIADSSVTSQKISDGVIASIDLANQSVVNNKLGAVAGDFLVASADTEHTNELHTVYTKKKEIVLPKSGTYRIKFDLKSNNNLSTVYGRIYKNGVAFGTERTQTSSAYTTYSQDLAFTAGDTLELWTKSDNNISPGTGFVDIRNLRVYEDSGTDFVINLN